MPYNIDDSEAYQDLLAKCHRLERERDTFVDHIAMLQQRVVALEAEAKPNEGLIRNHSFRATA